MEFSFNKFHIKYSFDEARYQRPGPSSLLVSDKKIFKSFTNRSLYIHKKGQIQPKVFIFSLYWAHVPNAAYQAPGPLTFWFHRRRFLKVFYHNWAWWPSWSCDPDVPPAHWGSMSKLALSGTVVSEEKTFETFTLWVYEKQVTPRAGPFLTPGL